MTNQNELSAPDLSKEKILYVVGYAHLDTQWRWDYAYTITECIRNTLRDNLALLDKYPQYRFNFTGSIRYEMMREYFPEMYERMREYVRQGRWCVSGSSVDEGDVNVPSPESIFRQILYGNRWFQRELGATSEDYMLPDCFGFPASFPSVLAHAGLKGFSTQKLGWGHPGGAPFPVGVWEGPDGKGIVCAFDPGGYADGISKPLDTDPQWVGRVNANGDQYGVYADYHYYGVGDVGGAPHEVDVQMLCQSMRDPAAAIRVVAAASDQMFKDITPTQAARLPHYRGDLLLREHSTGSLTSQSYMKRWNRKNECLADAAERAAVLADWLGALPYPAARMEAAWYRVLGSQFHDILPGTSVPRAYEFSWNDEVLALNQFAGILQGSIGATVQAMDTQAQGRALVVSNPLAIEREDAIDATLTIPGEPAALRVFDPDGAEVPSQATRQKDGSWHVLFVARVPANGLAVFDVRPAATAHARTQLAEPAGRDKLDPYMLTVSGRVLENAAYRVTVNEQGDIASIVDKIHGNREILAGPARLEFQYEKPREWPAWNMDWADRQQPPMDVVGGPATIRIVENGPARVALEVSRTARGSVFVQQIRLTAGGRRVEVKNLIEWQSRECSLKAAFPLTVSNPEATYNMGLGVMRRTTNHADQFEVPLHEWFDLTDTKGDYGVSILEDCKFGADKPSDHMLRLTLLYTPGIRGNFREQGTQDWGRHEIVYAIHGHAGDWRQAGTAWQARRLNQPLTAFVAPSHSGSLGRRFSLASLSTPQVDIRAVKRAEDLDAYVVRVQELEGRPASNVVLSFPAPVLTAMEADGQEHKLGEATVRDGKVVFDVEPFAPKTFIVTLAQPGIRTVPPVSQAVALPYDTAVASENACRTAGVMADGLAYPAELIPASLTIDGITFKLGDARAGALNAVTCRGQRVSLPAGSFNRVYALAAATQDTVGDFAAGGRSHRLEVPAWNGFIGQFDARKWEYKFRDIDGQGPRGLDALAAGYIKRTPVAWFGKHCHSTEKDEAYQFCYLFLLSVPLPAGTTEMTLPQNDKIRIMAISVAQTACAAVEPTQPLYDDFTGREPMVLQHRELELPRASVPFAPDLKADGELLKVDWSKATTLMINRSVDGFSLEKRAAEASLLHDGQYLYIRMNEPGNHAAAQDRSFDGDRWELFFAADRQQPYRQLGLFPGGGISHQARGEEPDVKGWTQSVTGRTVVRDGEQWSWQLVIPLDRFCATGVKPGDTVYMNFLRGTMDDAEPLAWSPIFSNTFHNLLRLGEVKLEARAAGVSR